MKSNLFTATIQALKLPLKLLVELVGKRKGKNELEQKQQAYVRNFDPTRLKNRSWQKNTDKNSKKKRNGKTKKSRPRSPISN